MIHYMLDTNSVSYFIKQHPNVVRRVTKVPMASLCISAVTAGELLFGLAKRPSATKLQKAVQEFLRRVDVMPWDNKVAKDYGSLRAVMQQQGKVLAPLDLLIAAHAFSIDATLITNDRAFQQVEGLIIENWVD